MAKWVVAGLVAGATMLVLDAFWLTMLAEAFYRRHLPGLLLEDGFRLAPALVFYLLYIAGVVYFAVLPALSQGKLSRAALNGALLGLVCYGTYDLTNHATMKVWSPLVTLADMLWGTVLTAIAASAGAFAALPRRSAQCRAQLPERGARR